jgi:hypothetical protein
VVHKNKHPPVTGILDDLLDRGNRVFETGIECIGHWANPDAACTKRSTNELRR